MGNVEMEDSFEYKCVQSHGILLNYIPLYIYYAEHVMGRAWRQLLVSVLVHVDRWHLINYVYEHNDLADMLIATRLIVYDRLIIKR